MKTLFKITDDSIVAKIFNNSFFDSGTSLKTPENKDNKRDVIGFYNGKLLEVKWVNESSIISFYFVNLPDIYVTDDYLMKLIDELNNLLKIYNINFEYFISSGWLIGQLSNIKEN